MYRYGDSLEDSKEIVRIKSTVTKWKMPLMGAALDWTQSKKE